MQLDIQMGIMFHHFLVGSLPYVAKTMATIKHGSNFPAESL